MEPQFTPVADHALLVSFGDTYSEAIHGSVVALDGAIQQFNPTGVVEVVPAIVNLLVSFDPVVTDHHQLETALRTLALKSVPKNSKTSKHTVHVCYEEPYCPDLAAVAAAHHLSLEATINAHLSTNYRVLMYGFAPGYAYLGGVPDTIQVPRKTAAVRDIPAGSVMIAGPQCLVTTLKMPTGWSIIGRSPTRILLDKPSRPFLFDVGDEVAFRRIDRSTYEAEYEEQGDE